MKRVAVLIAAVFAFVSMVAFAAEKNVGPEQFIIKEVQKRMGPVMFPHRKHQKVLNQECNLCHHKRQGDATPVRCSVCHGKVKEAPTFKKAMHGRCKVCHKQRKKEGKKAGPTKCSGCHKKK